MHLTSKIKMFKIIFEHQLFGCQIPGIFPVSILSASFFILFQIYPLVQKSGLRIKGAEERNFVILSSTLEGLEHIFLAEKKRHIFTAGVKRFPQQSTTQRCPEVSGAMAERWWHCWPFASDSVRKQRVSRAVTQAWMLFMPCLGKRKPLAWSWFHCVSLLPWKSQLQQDRTPPENSPQAGRLINTFQCDISPWFLKPLPIWADDKMEGPARSGCVCWQATRVIWHQRWGRGWGVIHFLRKREDGVDLLSGPN